MRKKILTFLTCDNRIVEVYIKSINNKARYEIILKDKKIGLLDIEGSDSREEAFEIIEDWLATDLREGRVVVKGIPYYVVKFNEFLKNIY